MRIAICANRLICKFVLMGYSGEDKIVWSLLVFASSSDSCDVFLLYHIFYRIVS